MTRRHLLDNLPAWQVHLERLAEAERIHARAVAEADAAGQRYRQAVEEHRAAVQAALRDGTPIPPDPSPPSDALQHAVQIAHERRLDLAAAGDQLRARLAPEVEHLAEARWRELCEEIRGAADLLTDTAREVQALAAQVAAARAAADGRHGYRERPSRSARTLTHWSAGDVVEAVMSDASPFALLPVPARRDLADEGAGGNVVRHPSITRPGGAQR